VEIPYYPLRFKSEYYHGKIATHLVEIPLLPIELQSDRHKDGIQDNNIVFQAPVGHQGTQHKPL
jgi:hypothetical protein